MNLVYVWLFVSIIFISMPFGYFREPLTRNISPKIKQFAVKMIIIHSPIFFTIPLRMALGVKKIDIEGDFRWGLVLAMIAFSVVGQVFGGRILPKLLGTHKSTSIEVAS